jgi:putative transposase
MCQVMGIHRSGFYTWLEQVNKPRDRENRMILERIRTIHADSKRKAYGSPRIRKELEKEGIKVGKNRVARLMKAHGIKAINVKPYRPQNKIVTDETASPNLLEQNFRVEKPNQAWVTDITYIRTRQGWVYLCVFLDLFSRKIVGWTVGKNMKTELVLRTLRMAVGIRKPCKGLIIHSDRGSQYGSEAYRMMLSQNGFVQSMSRKGNCWDNACIESFFHSMKYEYLLQFSLEGLEDTQWLCFKYIDAFYNTGRLHSYLGYVSPDDFEKRKIA